jgi:hypothetical protein
MRVAVLLANCHTTSYTGGIDTDFTERYYEYMSKSLCTLYEVRGCAVCGDNSSGNCYMVFNLV